MNDIEQLYQQYRREIRPYLEMLKHRQFELSDADWRDLVNRTKQNVTNSPDQYLSNLPKKDVLESLIERLFREFLDETV